MVFKLMIADFALSQNTKCVGVITRNTFLSLLIYVASFSIFYSGETHAVDRHEFEFDGEYVNNETQEVVQWSLRYVFNLDSIGQINSLETGGQVAEYPMEEWYLTVGSTNYSFFEFESDSNGNAGTIYIGNDTASSLTNGDLQSISNDYYYAVIHIGGGPIIFIIEDFTGEFLNDVNLFAGGVISATPYASYHVAAVGEFSPGFFGPTDGFSLEYPILTHTGGRTVPRSLDRFEISSIPDVQTNELFPITVTARLDNGAVHTGFNSCINLSTDHATRTVAKIIDGTSEICLTNGTGSEFVSIRGPGGADAVLEVKYDGDVLGTSNTFSVVDPLAIPTTLLVEVNFDGFHIGSFSGTVSLENPDGSVSEQSTQTADGKYSFTGLLPGLYKLWAVRDSGEWRSPPGDEILITAQPNPMTQTEKLLVNKVGQPPVLVLPGIMGSTINGSPLFKYDNYSYTPILPKERADSSELRILNGAFFAGDAGFDDLDQELSDFGYNVITVPWDWRASLKITDSKNAIYEYLIPALAKAKDPDGDGVDDFTKVDVVAHSMGGLLVRSYIQSNSYSNDIRRFAMVGTPIEGSAKVYPMIQGGEPQIADNLEGNCGSSTSRFNNPFCFYSRATDLLYKEMNDGESPFKYRFAFLGSDYSKVLSKETLVNFYKDDVPTGLQLAPTYDVLRRVGDSTTLRSLEVQPNQFLKDLNTSVRKDRTTTILDACNNEQKVGTKLFASINVKTLDNILVLSPVEDDTLYPDGLPFFEDLGVVDGIGDGTVPAQSAFSDKLNIDNLPADYGLHSGLMGKFKTEIRDFLLQECPL